MLRQIVLVVLAAGVAHAFPQQEGVTSVEPADQALNNLAVAEPAEREEAGRSGFASLEALADRVTGWFQPVKQYFDQAINDKTVSEVAFEARNASVNFATRVSETDVFQSAQDALTPLRSWFVGVRDSVKDKTLAELANDVKQQIDRLDQSVARFIQDFGNRDEPAAAADAVQEAPELDVPAAEP